MSGDGVVRRGVAGTIAHAFIDSKLTPLFIVFAIGLGLFATVNLPREEEPQIVVPMVDVFVEMPGASPREVAERLTKPLERRLWEIPGVEYLYSTSESRSGDGHRPVPGRRGRGSGARPPAPEAPGRMRT